VAALLVFSAEAARADQKPYTFAVVPQFPPAVIQRDWTPIIERIERISGVALELKFYRSIPEFEAGFLKGEPDFLYLSPYHAVKARRAQRYAPLVRDFSAQLKGILVVRRDSSVTSVRQLNGATIAFPSAKAFASSLYLRALMKQREKISFTPKYVSTHSNVYRHVLLGMVAAGGGANKTLNMEPAALRDQLRVLYETPGSAPHPVCAHPRVPATVRESFAAAFLALPSDATGRELLKAVEIERPGRADYEKDYQPLEALGLDTFAVAGEE
jgi:phosphonate transport system substrate-binding protein